MSGRPCSPRRVSRWRSAAAPRSRRDDWIHRIGSVPAAQRSGLAAHRRKGRREIPRQSARPGRRLTYAQSLRALGQRAQAVAVLEQASMATSEQQERCSAPTAARWRTSARYKQALEVLERAHTPDNPDWRILSAQGAVARSARTSSGSAALLCQRAENRAGRTIGTVESGPLLRARQGFAEGARRPCGAQ